MQFKPSVAAYMLTMIDYTIRFESDEALLEHLNGFQNDRHRLTKLNSCVDSRIPPYGWDRSFYVYGRSGADNPWFLIGCADQQVGKGDVPPPDNNDYNSI